jgi:glycosyltransferase involved in cell wall biosynthesis
VPPIEVIRNGVDVERAPYGPEARAAARRRLGVADEELLVGCVASLYPKKDHRSLIEAFARLEPARLRAQLVMVGSGPLEADLRARAAQLGLANRVMFVGSVPDPPALLPGFDVFALSSRYEGLPNALLEAMAAGLPAVATDVGGVAEVLEDGVSGLLAPAGDVPALAAALDRLLQDGQLRLEMGRRARELAGRFDIREVTRRTSEVYERVLVSHPVGTRRRRSARH